MATYKILQDIEAEDKLIGPLTLRQFIYAGITVVLGFTAFKLASLSIYVAIPFLPFIALFAVLAAPFGHDQPNEVWLIAKVNFFLKPHRRIWDQNVIHELVTITAPKKVEGPKLKKFSSGEAESKLQELARTIDTRGWSVKNVNVNLYTQPTYLFNEYNPERLVNVVDMPKEVSNVDVKPEDDIFETSNENNQNINQIIKATTESQRAYHESLITNSKKTPKPGSLFLSKQGAPGFRAPSSRPFSPTTKATTSPKQKAGIPMKAQSDNAILNLARDNNKSVATLAHEAKEQLQNDNSSQEVVISLH